MPRGDKSSYSDMRKGMAEHIEEGYEHHGVPAEEAKRSAWAMVNKETHGGKKIGFGARQENEHTVLAQGRPNRRHAQPFWQPSAQDSHA